MRDILPELNGKDYIAMLNKDYDIKFCEKEEVDDLIEFLRVNWKEDHIFVLDRKLFDWQHFNKIEQRYNYVIAKNKKSGEIHSVLGFVPTSQFDDAIKNIEVWPCVWKSRDDIQIKGLGVSLYYYLKEMLEIETISILGISEVALSIYKHWNFMTGKIKQYFIPNLYKKEYFIISNVPEVKKKDEEDRIICECLFNELETESEIRTLNINKYKSITFYINRYILHPTYEYKIYKIIEQEEIKLLLIARENHVNEAKCLRIVDFIGDIEALVGCFYSFQNLLKENDYEYVDFINIGISRETLLAVGFLDRDDSNVIIPGYFEPFLKENIYLEYAFKSVSNDAECVFVKADADQDRPNVLSL